MDEFFAEIRRRLAEPMLMRELTEAMELTEKDAAQADGKAWRMEDAA